MFWRWKKSEPIKEKTNEEKHLEIIKNQPDSLLESFVRYVNRNEHFRLRLAVNFKKERVLTVECQFKDEKNYHMNMRNDNPAIIQKDPEQMIVNLYDNKSRKKVNSEFQRMAEYQQDLNRLQWKIDNLNFVYKGKSSPNAREAMREVEEMSEAKQFGQKEHDDYMKSIWYNSPYLAERLHAIYRVFLQEHTTRKTDPVEADLLNILEDEELSDDTKKKADQMLSEYRAKKVVSTEDKLAHKENQALLTLSTIERHYLKRGEGNG